MELVAKPAAKDESLSGVERSKELQKLHQQTSEYLQKSQERQQLQGNKHKKTRVFAPGDLVWIHLSRERFPNKKSQKLSPRADGPFKVLERINNNAYKLELPRDYGVSATFNVADLSPYIVDDTIEDPLDLRANLPQARGDDGNQVQPVTGPITRARAKGLQSLVSRVLREELEPNEAQWLNSFTIHGCGIFNALYLTIQQEGATEEAGGTSLAKAGQL